MIKKMCNSDNWLIKISALCLLFFLAFCFGSCHKNDELVIVLDNSEPLALAPDVEWAVVTDPYAAYKKENSWSSGVAGHCRKGDILMVKGKSVSSDKEIWYYFENGWLADSCVSIYSNQLKAKAVSEDLLNSNK
ncbi:MAG: hypothetical protein HUJ68_08360 [Clostridia bacterium]|nr:hypothetical protein [Clostridia bacterium]